MGKKLSELDEDTTLTDTDILHIRGLDGVDKRITAANVKLVMPQLHLLDEADRTDGTDFSLNPTAVFAEQDLSALCPEGTTGLLILITMANTGAVGAISIRDGISAEANGQRTQTLQHLGAAAHELGVPIIIKATNGIFDVAEYGAKLVTNCTGRLWGYFL